VHRFHKLDFPMYDGSVDPLGWLNRCKRFFRGQRTGDKVWTAAYHLANDAQFWYLQLERDFSMPTWEQFKEACHIQFGPSLRANPLGELARLPLNS
uniref:Retrotransposon gag domain-containing protein n=1 Tax=Aegilops tauschii subsp. strangulata TaxID=200361 RepID=A0A453K7A6_AEGTS